MPITWSRDLNYSTFLSLLKIWSFIKKSKSFFSQFSFFFFFFWSSPSSKSMSCYSFLNFSFSSSSFYFFSNTLFITLSLISSSVFLNIFIFILFRPYIFSAYLNSFPGSSGKSFTINKNSLLCALKEQLSPLFGTF